MVTEKTKAPADDAPLHEFLAATDRFAEGALLNEQDYVNRALDFANAADAESLHAIQTMLMAGMVVQDQIYFPALQDSTTKSLQNMRAQLVERLEVILKDKKKARIDLANEVYLAGRRIAIRPAFLVTQEGVEIHYRHFPADLNAAFGYVLLLLLDAQRGYGRDLCRCKIKECQKFFLAIKPPLGRPRRDYCSQAHLEASRALTGVQRVQAYRKRQQAKLAQATRRKAK